MRPFYLGGYIVFSWFVIMCIVLVSPKGTGEKNQQRE